MGEHLAEKDHRCDTGNFDRTLCPEPCGSMHSFCSTCGVRQDPCAHDQPAEKDAVTQTEWGVVIDDLGSADMAESEEQAREWLANGEGLSLVRVVVTEWPPVADDQDESGPKQSVRDRVLAAVKARNITQRRTGHQWWTSEHEYRTLTTAERKHLRALEAEGVIRFETAGGYPNGWRIGGYALNPYHRATPPEGGA